MTTRTSNAPLTLAVTDGIATLTFTRPQKSNAYDKAMLRALGASLDRAADDPAIRVLVLRGEGRHFCAGADLSPEAQADKDSAPGIADVCRRLDTLPKPTLALVQGAAVGGGMALVCCCDIVITTADAFFSMPEVRLGFAPMPLLPFVLEAIGMRAARRVLMSGARLGAEEAQRLGLVQAVCEPIEAEQVLKAEISELLQSAPGAIGRVKSSLARLVGRPVTVDLLAELQQQFDGACEQAEAQEGRAARREKRPPNWSSRG